MELLVPHCIDEETGIWAFHPCLGPLHSKKVVELG